MSTLDFSKLAPPKGETFEGLIRLLGQHLGMVAEWSGRGADGGRDLIFVETLQGPIKARAVRWLVSCKDNSYSNRSITEREVGSITDKVKQHRCDGFLLATTTTASTGLKERLDRLDGGEGGGIQTKVWDRLELEKMLLSEQCAGLLRQFFPEYVSREAVSKLDAAREVVEAQLPRFIAGYVRMYLVSPNERRELMSGRNVWPHDATQQAIIDDLRRYVVHGYHLDEASQKAQNLQLDAFIAFCDALILNFPKSVKGFLVELVKSSNDHNFIYNAIDMLRESENFTFKDELKLTYKFDDKMLDYLYSDIAKDDLREPYSLWRDEAIKHFSIDHVDLTSIGIFDLSFMGREDGIFFDSNIELNAMVGEPAEHRMIYFTVKGHFAEIGAVIDYAEITDTD